MTETNISIVVPHYEKQEAFRITFDKLSPQLKGEDEVIVVDDNSSENIGIKSDYIKVVKPSPRIPHIYRLNTLRNLGIETAKNDAIIILDPDCIPHPNFMKYARQIYDPAILFGGQIDYFDANGKLLKEDPRGVNNRASRWVDLSERGCGMIWGGCMMFSKTRTEPLGWHDTAFDDGWGAEDHDFASKCYHSGMRLRYESALQVHHQHHDRTFHYNQDKNMEIWKKNMKMYEKNLNMMTAYNPAVAVLFVTMLRPYFIDQNIRAIFR